MRIKIIAETGAAHRKSYSRCLAMIDAARQCGADAIKFSAYKADEMTIDSNKEPFVIKSEPWKGMSLYSIYDSIAIPYHWLNDLKRATMAAGMEFILSVYHPNTVEILGQLGVKTVKIASFELNYTELLKSLANDPKVYNILLSTGGATEKEIDKASDILKYKDLTLLHCISKYPAKPEEMNLVMLDNMKKFGFKVGLSNHSRILTVPVMAVTMGATVLEQHLKLDDDNLDASFALFPDAFKAVVDVCRKTEAILGTVDYSQPKTFHRKEINGKWVRAVW